MKCRRRGALLAVLAGNVLLLAALFIGHFIHIIPPSGTAVDEGSEEISPAAVELSGDTSPAGAAASLPESGVAGSRNGGPLVFDTPDGLVELIEAEDGYHYYYSVPFENVMGMSGYKKSTYRGNPLTELAWRTTEYHANASGSDEPGIIAESFSFNSQGDYIQDIDGDGVTELICNCQYGGDGAQRVLVYRKNGDTVECGRIQLDKVLPEDAIAYYGVAETYNPVTQSVMISYMQEITLKRIEESFSSLEEIVLFEHFEP